jgi:hypothetical protein
MYTHDFKFRFPMAFKGERDYVTGADIVALAVEHAAPKGPWRIDFRKPVTHALTGTWATGEGLAHYRKAGEADVVLTTTEDGVERYFVLGQDRGKPVTDRVPYDEDAVSAGAVIDGDMIVQDAPAGAGTIYDRIAALNKRLLNETIEQHPWKFTRLECDYVPREVQSIRILRTANMGALVHSEIEVDGKYLGTIDFMR